MGLDSVALLLAIEEEFDVDFPQQDAEKLFTVGDVYVWLKVHADYDEPGSEEKIWQRLVRVFCHQLNVLEEDVKPGASIVKDLGVE